MRFSNTPKVEPYAYFYKAARRQAPPAVDSLGKGHYHARPLFLGIGLTYPTGRAWYAAYSAALHTF